MPTAPPDSVLLLRAPYGSGRGCEGGLHHRYRTVSTSPVIKPDRFRLVLAVPHRHCHRKHQVVMHALAPCLITVMPRSEVHLDFEIGKFVDERRAPRTGP